MNCHPSRAPGKLRIWQQNTRKSDTAQAEVLAAARPEDWDALAIQEPFLDRVGNTKANRHWRVLYPSDHQRDGSSCTWSILLINANISTDTYTQLTIHSTDITAVRFAGEFGHLSLFNVYNDCTHNKVLFSLSSFLSSSLHLARPSPGDHMVWLGDFNRHHPLWEPVDNCHLLTPRDFIQPLLDLLSDYDMELALPPGIPTLQTSANRWTRPDDVWRTHSDVDPIIFCDVDASLRPSLADHLPIITEIELPVPRSSTPPSRDFRAVDWTAFSEALTEQLNSRSPAVHLTTAEAFDRKVSDLSSIIQEIVARDDVVPLWKPCPHTKRWWNDDLKRLKAQRRRACNQAFKHRDVPDHPSIAEASRIP
ncbi:hypothetical protein J132_04497 [Termitomyces sp. J132]|nr:hypothetical protein J132_04497 [Termitomyces sp. J132]